MTHTDGGYKDYNDVRLQPDEQCFACGGEGWVCEDHNNLRWEDCDCGGAGQACGYCDANPYGRPPVDEGNK